MLSSVVCRQVRPLWKMNLSNFQSRHSLTGNVEKKHGKNLVDLFLSRKMRVRCCHYSAHALQEFISYPMLQRFCLPIQIEDIFQWGPNWPHFLALPSLEVCMQLAGRHCPLQDYYAMVKTWFDLHILEYQISSRFGSRLTTIFQFDVSHVCLRKSEQFSTKIGYFGSQICYQNEW